MTEGDLDPKHSLDFSQASILSLSMIHKSLIEFRKKLKRVDTVKSLSDGISIEKMREFLTKFSAFHTRYYKSSTGRESSLWLLDMVKSIASKADASVVSDSVKPCVVFVFPPTYIP